MKQIDMGLLFGGQSCEHEVSLLSAAAVADNLPPDIRLHLIGIDREGEWFLYTGESARIADGSWRADTDRLAPVLPARRGYLLRDEGAFRPLSVVFPAVHGPFCEDGRLQGLLDCMGISYVGCGVEASAVAMNKVLTKTVLARAHVPMASWISSMVSSEADLAPLVHRAEGVFAYPIFVKPARSGSSVGAGAARNRGELYERLRCAAAVDPHVLLERYIKGREIEVAVLDGATLTVSRPGELRYASSFYDYDAKYRGGGARMIIPARLSRHTEDRIRRLAEQVFRLLDCRHLARVDFFLTANGEIFFNEINTLPGMTPFSMYPSLLQAAGISFPELIRRLICLSGGEEA